MCELNKIELSLVEAATRCHMTIEETAHMLCALESVSAMKAMVLFLEENHYPTDSTIIQREVGRLILMEEY